MLTQVFQVSRLRGMDERWRTDPSSALKIVDMTWNLRDGWQDAGGFREIVNDYTEEISGGINSETKEGKGSTATANAFDNFPEITSLHWFAQHNGARQWLIWETSDKKLSHFDGSKAPSAIKEDLRDSLGNQWDGTTLKRTYISTPWQRTQSAAWGDRLYIVNGYDEPVVFDGYKTSRAGFEIGPTPPYPTNISGESSLGGTYTFTQNHLGVGSSQHRNGYRYRVSFVNERGQESPLSASSETVIAKSGAVSRPIIGVTIPTGGTNVVARRLYRTMQMLDDNGQGIDGSIGREFYFHSEIQDNVATLVEDFFPDAVLGSLVDPLDFGPWPTNAKFIASFKGTMFLAGGNANDLLFSAPNQPEIFPADNVLHIGEGDAGPITGFYPTKNALVVFKSRATYLVRGNPVDGFFADTLTRDVGCVAANSIAELPGVGAVFLSNQGVYALVGALQQEGTPTRMVHLSATIPDTIERLNRSALVGAFGTMYHRDKEYWLAVPTLGSAQNNLVLIYHYEIGEWSIRKSYPINCMVETHDHRGYLIFGSHDEKFHSGIHVYSRGWPNKNGVPISPLYETAHMDFGSVYNAVQPARIMAFAVGYGDNDLEVNFTVNREDTKALSANKVSDQTYPLDDLPVYGTVVWGAPATDQWSEHRPVVIRYDISAIHKGPVSELQVSFNPTGRRIQLVGYDLEVKTGEQRAIKPLTTALTHERR